MRPRTLKIVAGMMVFGVSLGCYFLTLAPTITWEHDGVDSWELVAAAYTVGVAHPPGYPLFLMLARLFTLLPLGEVAVRVNLMSAVFAAITSTIIYFTILLLTPGRMDTLNKVLIASASSLLFGFSHTFWSQAIIAEVYSLNALLVAAAVLLAALYRSTPNRKLLWMLGLTLGLGLANHLSILPLFPAILYLAVRRHSPGPSAYLGMGGLFVVGLSTYLYLPLSSAQHPPIDWGACRTWSGFWWTVSARIYHDYAFALPLPYLPVRLATWLRMLTQQFTWVGFALGLVGLWRLWASDRQCLVFSITSFTAVTIYSLTYNTSDSHIYLIPSYLLFTLWIAEGTGHVIHAAPRPRAIEKRDGLLAPSRLQRILSVALILLPALLVRSNLPQVSLREDRKAHEYAASVLAAAPSNAIIIADTDAHIFSLWYVRYVETTQPAPVIVAKGLFHYQWYQDTLRWHEPKIFLPASQGDTYADLFAFLDGNLPRRPIYLTDYDERILARYAHVRQGSLYKLGVKG